MTVTMTSLVFGFSISGLTWTQIYVLDPCKDLATSPLNMTDMDQQMLMQLSEDGRQFSICSRQYGRPGMNLIPGGPDFFVRESWVQNSRWDLNVNHISYGKIS